ncbi:MAG: hypothetical protein HOL85_15750 [Rhodospirillaceae bacterium]|jgi:hypothetical protein|nr:hypothetical protein [Rhodospirillaceae bacterium]MBT6137111.1 hypothetical protein [Rhodospirillaceae bacterium]
MAGATRLGRVTLLFFSSFAPKNPLYFAPNAECVKIFIRLDLDCLLKCNFCGAIKTMLLDQSLSYLFRIRAR